MLKISYISKFIIVTLEQFFIDIKFALFRFGKSFYPSKFELEIIKLGIFSNIMVEF